MSNRILTGASSPRGSSRNQQSMDRSAVVAWSPVSKCLIALGGTSMGADFSRTTLLELVDVTSFEVVYSIPVDGQFRAISWTESMSHGVIAGGLDDGTVTLWDPALVFEHEHVHRHGPLPVIFSAQLHANRGVSALAFHPTRPSMFASCGLDGSLVVVNLERPDSPEIIRPTLQQANVELTCLAWNPKVPYILAVASSAGKISIVDLRENQRKEVRAFEDPSRRKKISSIAWNPTNPTQLAAAYNEDGNPGIQFWDVSKDQPIKEVAAHSRGVLGLAWSETDPNLLVSSGKEGRVVCWSVKDGGMEILSELSGAAGQVALNSCGLSAVSGGGLIVINSICENITNSKYIPKWETRSACCGNFGFGGKLIKTGQGSIISIHSIPEDAALLEGASQFEQFMANRNFSEFCNQQATHGDERERLGWDLLGEMLNGSGGFERVKSRLLEGLGVADVSVPIEQYLGRRIDRGEQILPASPRRSELPNDPVLDEAQIDSVFDQLAGGVAGGMASSGMYHSGVLSPGGAYSVAENLTDWNSGPEALIKGSLLCGDLRAAVEMCVQTGRMAEALVFASGGGQELFDWARGLYLKRQGDPFVKRMGVLLSGDLQKAIKSWDLSSWTEALAVIATYCSDAQNFSQLCGILGERLEKERFDLRSAILCYIACADFSKTAKAWAGLGGGPDGHAIGIQKLVEKMTVLQAATGGTTDELFLNSVVEYSKLLANSGDVDNAMRYLCLIPDNLGSAKYLKERIFNSNPARFSGILRSVPIPWETVDVKGVAAVRQPLTTGSANQPRGPQLVNPAPSWQARGPATGSAGVYGGVSPSASRQQTAPPPPPNRPAPPGVSAPSVVQRPSTPSNPANSHLANRANQIAGYGMPGHSGQPGHPGQPAPAGPPGQFGYTSQPPQQSFPTPPSAYAVPQQPPTSNAFSGGYPQASYPQASYAPGSFVPSGPPTTGGSSTAPQASAVPLTPGLPVSWPVPTPSQQKNYLNEATRPNNAAVAQSTRISAEGPPMSASDVGVVRRVLGGLVEASAADGNKRKYEDMRSKITDLISSCETGGLSISVQEKLLVLCRCVEAGDSGGANRVRIELSSSDWDANKNWLMAVKILLPK